jgi:hypothetical protein
MKYKPVNDSIIISTEMRTKCNVRTPTSIQPESITKHWSG